MTLQFSMNNVYFIWRRDSASFKTFMGTVTAIDAAGAAAAAEAKWGAARYAINAHRSARTIMYE